VKHSLFLVVFIIFMGIFPGCVKSTPVQKSKYAFDCVNVDHNLRRCENQEVICYTDQYLEIFQCTWKNKGPQ